MILVAIRNQEINKPMSHWNLIIWKEGRCKANVLQVGETMKKDVIKKKQVCLGVAGHPGSGCVWNYSVRLRWVDRGEGSP
jgi:hypothetical protein